MTGDAEVRAQWFRAEEALKAAAALVTIDPNSSASRAYYAAFHAVSALFGLEGRHFAKHQELRASVHRDLVNAGRWADSLGKDFDHLRAQRDVGDYGSTRMVTEAEAVECVEAARRIIAAVRGACGEAFGSSSED